MFVNTTSSQASWTLRRPFCCSVASFIAVVIVVYDSNITLALRASCGKNIVNWKWRVKMTNRCQQCNFLPVVVRAEPRLCCSNDQLVYWRKSPLASWTSKRSNRVNVRLVLWAAIRSPTSVMLKDKEHESLNAADGAACTRRAPQRVPSVSDYRRVPLALILCVTAEGVCSRVHPFRRGGPSPFP